MSSEPLPSDAKRRALERVLGSRTFSRAEQLRAFLRYIGEAEFDGRAQQLNEYALGVAVFGRPADYSPAEDSCVRSRAYELRNKLKSYYQTEAPEDPIRIEVDKGGYVPRFELHVSTSAGDATSTNPAPDPTTNPTPDTTPDPTLGKQHAAPPATSAGVSSEHERAEPQHSDPARSIEPKPATAKRRLAVRAFVMALLVALAAVFYVSSFNTQVASAPRGLRSEFATPEMQALWNPLLESDAPLLMAFETRLFFYAPGTGLVVRDYQTNQLEEVKSSQPLNALRERMGSAELEPRLDYADFGAVHAAFLIGRMLEREVGLEHSSSLDWQDVWNSNVIFIGKPDLNPSIRHALEEKDFATTPYGNGIRNLHPKPGEPELYRSAEAHGEGEKFALITVQPGPQPGRRMLILSGAGAELMWALAEAVTSPARVKEIMSRVMLPSGRPPSAFQVVISATFRSNVPIQIRYVNHRASTLE